jgi:carbon-monoxide dehydrogenase large subunit
VSSGDAALAFAEADVVVRATIDYGRQIGLPMETRGAVAQWDPFTDVLDIWVSSQAPHLARDLLGEILGLPTDRIRVRVPDVGGGFGNKFDLHAEEVLAAMLSKRSMRAVKLIEDRHESFVATVHSREQRNVVELAATRDGVITGMRGTVHGVMGAVLGMVGSGPAHATATLMTGPYHVPNFEVELVAVVTNRPPVGSYRGWGSPEANYTHERLVELLAKELGLPANEIRRRNLVQDDQFPYSAPYYRYDSGRYGTLLALAEETVADLGWDERKRAAHAEGRRLGIGYSFHVEVTAAGNSRDMNAAGLQHSGFDREVVRIEPTGGVTVYTGQIPMGQGIQTALAQVAADSLGVPVDTVHVVTGDTESTPYTGYGSGGSRGAAVAGTALMVAARSLRQKVLRIAGHMLEAEPSDLEIDDGHIRVRGVPELEVTYREIGDAAYRRLLDKLPEEESPTLEESFVYDPPDVSFAYGCSAALVEVDLDTGGTQALEYVATHDSGVVINPRIVEGQVIGGLAQGLGGALLEEVLYDAAGVPMTDSLRNYLVPLATDVPRVTLRHLSTPSPFSPSGMKGVGEGGTIGTAAALTAAVDDALADLGVHATRVPITPEYLREQIGRAS